MPEATLFCSRPHSRLIDFVTARFVVSTARGLDVTDRHLEYGDVVPEGVLSADALRQEYEPPLRHIELLEFVSQDPELQRAYQDRNPEPVISGESSDGEADIEQVRLYDDMDREELVALCRTHKLSPSGNSEQLRRRLRAKLG